MKVIVTGAAGFIGSNIVRGLNRQGIHDVVAVDDLTDGQKFINLRDLRISDYFDCQEFYGLFAQGALGRVDAVFHDGACSDTMEHNGRFMMETNFRCSKSLLDACLEQNTRLIYASSAAVYGASKIFREEPAFERPLNVYGYSKLLFDQVVRRRLANVQTQIAGFRYFNVYGPHEQHKGRMASVAFHHFNQYRQEGTVRLFAEYGGYGSGEQQRDFVFIDDVVAVNLWFLQYPEARGIFNVGSGRAQQFNDVAHSMVNACRVAKGDVPITLQEMVRTGLVAYIPMPAALQGKYQCHTLADLAALRACGCDIEFANVATGVGRYADWLLAGD
ncbi:MAG: ADP-L-glycero-D-mannoheptose-6-epimerase [Gammaproteobacteria bacterium]|jgi:ADP-L-glycero-D-manno-heptose 6-epimerase|nr:ADP-L-glycero-D-mannoheptose-6-epimerase [Gammaproteobacteria bacterium]